MDHYSRSLDDNRSEEFGERLSETGIVLVQFENIVDILRSQCYLEGCKLVFGYVESAHLQTIDEYVDVGNNLVVVGMVHSLE